MNVANTDGLCRTIIETLAEAVVVVDELGRVQWWNPAARRQFGFEDATGQDLAALIPALTNLRGDAVSSAEGRRPDGTTFPLQVAVREIHVGGERRFAILTRDFTEEHRLAARARAERERLELAAQGAMDGLWERNFVTGDVYVSDRCLALAGYAPGELVRPMDMFESSVHPDDRARVLEHVDRHLVYREPLDVEYRLRMKSGDYRWFHTTGQAVWGTDGAPLRIAGSTRDVTQERQVEQRFVEQTTLARIGEMAAVVAHEVRNPLAAIRGVVEVIQSRFPPDSPDQRVLGTLLTRVDTLDALVTDLLVYARPAPPDVAPTDIMSVLDDVARLVRHDTAYAHVDVGLEGGCALLPIDRAQIGRALLNVVTNAAQAMPEGGRIQMLCQPKPDCCRLTISDNGSGMPPEVKERCVEPFFTTRVRGTGLGLPIAKRVVEQHGGRLSLESTEGVGTTVTVELPYLPPRQITNSGELAAALPYR